MLLMSENIIFIISFSGVQHLPAIVYESGQTNLREVGLESYEVLGCDPLHTFKGLTTNLYSEIPRHLENEEKKLLERKPLTQNEVQKLSTSK